MSESLAQEPAVGIEPTTARLRIVDGGGSTSDSAGKAPRAKSRRTGAGGQAGTRTAIKRPTTRHPAYPCWRTMRQRCLNPRNPNYPRYGGRGITICAAWLASFDAFACDMGERPPGATLERIDNDGPYSPENVRWATREEQGQNRHDVRPFTFDGRTQTLCKWVREWNATGRNPHRINESTLRVRLNRLGWTLERALATPPLHPSRDRHLYAEAALLTIAAHAGRGRA